MLILRSDQVVLSAWMALTGTAPSHTVFNSHVALARSPGGIAAWTAEVNAFVNANFAGADGNARLADTVIANLGLGAVTGIRDAAIAFFNSQPANRGGLAIAAADWLRTVTPAAGDTALSSAQAAFRNAELGGFSHSTNPASVQSAATTPGAPITGGGQTFLLTTGIDGITGTAGNDTINAPVVGTDTFSSLDAINGGAGIDTLNLVFDGTLAAGTTVQNVEIANLTSTVAITAANVTGFTGLETLNVASAAAISGVVAAATTNINVLNGMAGVTVNGGNNVVVNNSTAGNIVVGDNTAAAGTVTATNSHQGGTIGIKGAGALTATANDGAITFTNGTSVTAIASQAVALATRDANAAAAAAAYTANTAATTNTDASGLARVAAEGRVTALTTLATAINTADSVSASQTAANSIGLATTTALGAGAITFAEKTAIDAAFATGLVTSAAAARAAAQALVTPLQTAATAAQAAAQAADVINDANAAAALAAAQAVVNADNTKAGLVDGVDVIAKTNTALTSVTVKGNYDNNAANSNTIADGSTLRNTLTTVTLENAGKSQITGQAVTNVSATGMNEDVTVVNTTANHTANFTLSGITAGIYTAGTGATTVNIASTGAATNALTGGLTATGATAINLTGTAGLTFGTLNAAANAVIDASANSGTNTITVAAGQKYVGGSGVDVVTAGNALQTAIVDGGAGTADRLILAHNVNFDGTGAAKFLNFEVLQANTGTPVDLTRFTGSTFTSLILSGNATVSGLNAAQAGAISIAGGGTQALNIGVAGAATVGQIDTVSITNNTADATLTAPTLTGVEILNIASGKDLTIAALTSATALTNVNLTGAGTVSITSGALALNVNSVVDASAATGAVTLNFAAGTGNGIALRGGSGNDVLTGSNVADRGNQLSGGAGNNTITGGQAADVITAGHGNNTINGNDGNDTIVAGNGINVINGGAGNDTITVGTGYNLITGGAGRDVVTFAANAAGVINGLVYAAAGETHQGVIASGSTALTAADVITGFGAGDTIDLTALTTNAFTAGALGSALLTASTGTIALVRGNFDAATNVFTASATGTSSLLNWDDNGTAAVGNFEAIVLVGFAGTGSTTADGLITLA